MMPTRKMYKLESKQGVVQTGDEYFERAKIKKGMIL